MYIPLNSTYITTVSLFLDTLKSLYVCTLGMGGINILVCDCSEAKIRIMIITIIALTIFCTIKVSNCVCKTCHVNVLININMIIASHDYLILIIDKEGKTGSLPITNVH